VVLPEADVEKIWAAIESDPTTEVTVDLEAKNVRLGNNVFAFDILFCHINNSLFS
jgi:3-isopropylmalate/(R)-2-methylmalate dehydratase small subunit